MLLLALNAGDLDGLLPGASSYLKLLKDAIFFAFLVSLVGSRRKTGRSHSAEALLLRCFVGFALLCALNPSLPSLGAALSGFRLTGLFLLSFFVAYAYR